MSSSIRVLIVDDDPLVNESISAFLEDDGFIVNSASTAEEAVEILKSSFYQVCITDLTLPGMDGETFAIQAHTESPGTSFIIHSGMNYVPSSQLLETGFTEDNVMAKPIIRLEQLSLKIRKLAGTVGER